MSQHQPSGSQHPHAGQSVHYIGHDGRTHNAVIDKLDGNKADLTAHIDGSPQKLTGVSHGASGAPNTWDYAPKQP